MPFTGTTTPNPGHLSSAVVKSLASNAFLDGTWWLLADPRDKGCDQGWHQQPPETAHETIIPAALQETLPGVHGIVWYWREFTAPIHRVVDGRYLLRFAAVDHAARVWVNGRPVGDHEGGETPFVLDATGATRPGEVNRLAIRVINPTPDGVAGLQLDEVAHRNRKMPFTAGASWNLGGLTGSVELVLVPRVWVTDLFAHANPGEHDVKVRLELRNESSQLVEAKVSVSVAPASEGHTLGTVRMPVSIPPQCSVTVPATVPVGSLQLWQLEHPVLYRASAVVDLGPDGSDEVSRRFGVRDFRFTNGAFRLNDRPLFLRMTHTVNDYPLTGNPALTRDLLRRDLIHLKTLGFNMVRFIWGASTPEQLDLCDELGLLVYAESFASWPISASARMPDRFSSALEGVVRRDRNHPAIVIWGLLNESHDVPAFQYAVDYLPRLQELDGSRMAALNSGRFEQRPEVPSLANPGSTSWDVPLGAEATGSLPGEGHSWPPTDAQPMGTGSGPGDVHIYPRVPHTAATIRQLRELGKDYPHPVFLSEYGIGSAVDLWRVTRQYEEQGAADSDDAIFYRHQLDSFLADWERWRLDQVFGHPSRFYAASLSRNGAERALGVDAVRANPNMVGYGLTGAVDQVMCGEGLASTFRELKPGTVDALTAALAPARWCVFASAELAYVGTSVRFEVVLANDGALAGEDLPVLAQLLGPTGEVWRSESSLTVPPVGPDTAPTTLPVLDETIPLEGPAGRYTFRVGFERGGAPTGGTVNVLVTNPVTISEQPCLFVGDVPAAALELLGPGSAAWNGQPADAGTPVIWWEDEPNDEESLREASRRLLSEGGTIICLSARTYARLAGTVPDPASVDLGNASTLHSWLYLRDDWARRHPIFDGLQSGGLLDYALYRDVISDEVFYPGNVSVTAIAGAIKASQGYESALTTWEQRVGPGLLIGCTFRIRELVGVHPVADKLLANLVRYGAAAVSA